MRLQHADAAAEVPARGPSRQPEQSGVADYGAGHGRRRQVARRDRKPAERDTRDAEAVCKRGASTLASPRRALASYRNFAILRYGSCSCNILIYRWLEVLTRQ